MEREYGVLRFRRGFTSVVSGMLSRRHKRAIVGITAFGLLAAVILFSIGRFFAQRSLERQLAEERATLVAPEPLVVAVTRATIERRRVFAARAEPWVRTTLATEVGGTVQRIGAEVGTRVDAGAELLALDETSAAAGAAVARIQAEEAARRLREVEQLVRTEAVATTEGAAAGAAAAVAEREAERAEIMLNKHRLHAPYAGTVQARHVDVGDYLNPGQPAFELVDVARLRVVFQAGETEIRSFREGTELEVAIPSMAGRTASAIVRHVAPAAGANGLFRVEAELPNPRSEIAGGLAVTVTARVQLYRDMLFIPTAAVRLEGSRAVVQRIDATGSPSPVSIEIGPEIEARFPVLSGLAEGDRLIVR
jgi:RND family efflux transporter MFP subunit